MERKLLPAFKKAGKDCGCEKCAYMRFLHKSVEMLVEKVRQSEILTPEDRATYIYRPDWS